MSVDYRTGEGPLGVNLNGIVASPDGSTLLVVQTNTGRLFRIDVGSGRIAQVAVEGSDLQFGDGLLLSGERLYVVRNQAEEIVELMTQDGWRSATTASTRTSPLFAFPTALAELHGRLLVTNSQLDATAAPQLPFTVLDLPLTPDS